MPLSDEEERVIAAIERQFAKESAVVRVRSVGTQRRRPLLQPALLCVGSLLLTVIGFTSHVIVGVVGFLSLVASMMALCRSFSEFRPE